MNAKIILLLCLILSLLFQTTLVSFPLYIIFSILLFILYPEWDMVLVIFLGALVLDMLQVVQLGSSAVFILVALLITSFAQKFFNTKDYKSVLAILFLATITYATIFSYSINILLYLILFVGIFVATHFYYVRIARH